MGFLPEALTNFLGLMGHSMADGREQFALSEFVAEFDIARVSLGAPVFDGEKLAWLNGQWLRGLGDDAFAERVGDWLFDRERLMALVPLVKQRTERLADLPGMVDYLLGEPPAPTAEALRDAGLDDEALLEVLQFALWRLEALTRWEREAIVEALSGLADALGLKVRALLAPLFVAVASRRVALPLYDSLVVLGPELSRARLRRALDVLGGVSKKQAKRLEKRYRGLAEAGGEAG